MPKTARGQQKLFEKKLFYGDNLDILRAPEHFRPETVDLVYLDPPFKPNEKYNLLFRDEGDKDKGALSASQVRAFDDTWKWGSAARTAFNDIKENAPHHVRETAEALQTILGFSNMFAYLAMMAPRLVELRRVMKPTASIYLHCDPAASHYLKVLMDSVFGPENFRSEITWVRTTTHNDAKRWSPNADVILYYGKTGDVTWNRIFVEHSAEYVESKYRYVDADGRRYRLDNMTSPNPRPNLTYTWKGHAPPANGWRYSRDTMARLDAEGRIWYPDTKSKRPQLKRYLDEQSGGAMGNVWTDIPPINSQARERLKYPTQKPEVLLARIVTASSNEGDVVLDPFCGCGTTIEAAEELGRNWLGIDISYDAIPVIRERLAKRGLQDGTDYEVEGAPTTNADAEKLAKEDKYRFQWWAVRRLGGRETDNIRKKGSDKGVDGRLTLITDGKGEFPEAIISVKGGATGPAHVRELVGTVKAQKAAVGVLVVLKRPTRGMVQAADAEGGYPGRGGEFCPRIQILTAEDIINDVGVKAPAALATEPAKAKGEARKSVRPTTRGR
jgi:site-specific DNA-methyltransferase (adenine-specific)